MVRVMTLVAKDGKSYGSDDKKRHLRWRDENTKTGKLKHQWQSLKKSEVEDGDTSGEAWIYKR